MRRAAIFAATADIQNASDGQFGNLIVSIILEAAAIDLAAAFFVRQRLGICCRQWIVI
jgi:hypothetical protein